MICLKAISIPGTQHYMGLSLRSFDLSSFLFFVHIWLSFSFFHRGKKESQEYQGRRGSSLAPYSSLVSFFMSPASEERG